MLPGEGLARANSRDRESDMREKEEMVLMFRVARTAAKSARSSVW